MLLHLIKKRKTTNIHDNFQKLYEYDRNINEEYLNKFNEYEKNHKQIFNFHSIKDEIPHTQLISSIIDSSSGYDYKLKYMKLITLDILLNKSFSFKCLKTANTYKSNKCFHYLIKNDIKKSGVEYDDVIVYVFDNADYPFFVVLGNGSNWGALDVHIHYIYYYNVPKLYNLFYRAEHYLEDKFTICKSILEYYNNNINNIKTSNNVSYMIGFQSNIGHTYWNDISGFNFLREMDILKYIDTFIIGPYDYYNISDYLKNNNFKIIKTNDITKINNVLNNNLLVKYNDWYMSESLKNFVVSINPFNDINELNQITYVKNNYYPILTFNLRAVYRNIHNQEEYFSNIINNLLIIYPKLYIIFDGYTVNPNVNLDLYGNEGVRSNLDKFNISYIAVVDKIISMINTKNYISLIGSTINRVFKWLDISTYGLMQLGAGSYLYTWIMNKKALYIGRNEYINDELLIHTYHDYYYREKRDFTTYINPKLVDFNTYAKPNSEFAYNWKKILCFMLRDIIILEKYKHNLSQHDYIVKYNYYMNWNNDINLDNLIKSPVQDIYKLLQSRLV
jgi:hypothetical protein